MKHINFLIILLYISIINTAYAEEKPSESSKPKIIFLAEWTLQDQYAIISENISNQLRDLLVTFSTRWTNKTGDDFMELAHNILIHEKQHMIFWLNMKGEGKLYFLYIKDGQKQLIQRDLSGSGVEAQIDAISLISRMAIKMFLAEKQEEKDYLKVNHEQIDFLVYDYPKINSKIQLKASYAVQWAASTPLVTHGLRLSFEWFLTSLLKISASSQVSSSLESKESKAEIKVFRVPFYLGLGLISSKGNWTLGSEIAAGFSASRNTPKSLDENLTVLKPYGKFVFTAELLFLVERKFYDNWGLFLSPGVEMLPIRYTYKIENGPVLFNDIYRIQPKFLVGFFWGK